MTRVVILKVAVAKGREAEFEALMAQRATIHKAKPGFQRMYVLRPSGRGGEYRCVAWWNQIKDPTAWVKTETYAMSEDHDHAGLVVGPVPHEVLEVVREF